MDAGRAVGLRVGGEAIDQLPSDAAIAKIRRDVHMQMRGELFRPHVQIGEEPDIGKPRRNRRIVDRADEVADNTSGRRHCQIRELWIVTEIAPEPPVAKCHARSLGFERFRIARFKENGVDAALDFGRQSNVEITADVQRPPPGITSLSDGPAKTPRLSGGVYRSDKLPAERRRQIGGDGIRLRDRAV